MLDVACCVFSELLYSAMPSAYFVHRNTMLYWNPLVLSSGYVRSLWWCHPSCQTATLPAHLLLHRCGKQPIILAHLPQKPARAQETVTQRMDRLGRYLCSRSRKRGVYLSLRQQPLTSPVGGCGVTSLCGTDNTWSLAQLGVASPLPLLG